MPNTTGGLAILPQYQGTAYDLQRQQALAGALMQGALQGQPAPQPAGGGYQYVPKMSPISGLSQLGQALLASRVGGQASQGLGNLGQQQWQALAGSNGTGGFGASAAPGASSPPLQSAPAGQPVDDGTAGVVGVSGQLSGEPQRQQGTQGMLAPGGPMNPLGIPTQQAALMYLNSPDEYWKTQAQAFKPAEIRAQIRAAGLDPDTPLGHQIAQQAIAKANYIPPVSGRPGGSLTGPDGVTHYELPAPQQGAMWATNTDGTLLRNQAGQPYQIGIGGADAAVQGMARAKAAGEGSVLPYAGNDALGNPLPVTNRTAAATQGAGGVPPIPTIPGSGAPAPGGAAPLPGGPLPGGAAPGGPVYAAAPMGATSNANAAQQASADTMKADYGNMQQARQEAPTILQAYDHLTELANRAPKFVQGGIGGAIASTPAAAYVSSDAAEYDKTRAFLISSLGKTLGKNNSDAARATISQMIPEYGKPLPAKLEGLSQGRNQVAVKALRASVLTPAFQAGDSKGYTNLANQFDNNVKPSMMPALQLSGDEQRAAIAAQLKADPSLRSNFQWALDNGLLK